MTTSHKVFFDRCCLEQAFAPNGVLSAKKFVDGLNFYDVDVVPLIDRWVDIGFAVWEKDNDIFRLTKKAYASHRLETYYCFFGEEASGND